jgi:hypothetical protein
VESQGLCPRGEQSGSEAIGTNGIGDDGVFGRPILSKIGEMQNLEDLSESGQLRPIIERVGIDVLIIGGVPSYWDRAW